MIRYRRLFDVEIAHDYFLSRGDAVLEAQADADRAALTRLYSVDAFLEALPDDRTMSVLAGHKMIFRTSAAGFTVAVQLDPSAIDVRPMVPPGADFRLTFVLRLSDTRFVNYTELGPVSTGFYRFGNDSQNRTAGVNFLSTRVPAFVATRRYVAGEIRAEAAGSTFDLFLAVRDTDRRRRRSRLTGGASRPTRSARPRHTGRGRSSFLATGCSGRSSTTRHEPRQRRQLAARWRAE